MAKKKLIDPEVRRAAYKMNFIMFWGQNLIDYWVTEHGWDPSEYEMTVDEKNLLRMHLVELAEEPVSHRPARNKSRDLAIAGRVESEIQKGAKRQTAYEAVCESMQNDKIQLEPARVGQIYRSFRESPLVAFFRPGTRIIKGTLRD